MAFRVPSKNLKWSQIFGKLQEAKKRLHIEDYSIAQASLEQVFLSFTKYQREENN
jgi:ATP-binding cassette subfamily A (ABC1) protein 3